jgi:hypothetical protein
MLGTLRFAHPHFNQNENAARDWTAFDSVVQRLFSLLYTEIVKFQFL